MKQQPQFEEARPEMFRLFLAQATDNLMGRFRRTTGSITGEAPTTYYILGANRKRVRRLARLEARAEMRRYRRENSGGQN